MKDEIYGYIERITFQNPETGYTVAQLQQPRKSETTTLVGNMTSIQPGETIRCRGEWKNHLIHGRQFMVEQCQIEMPADVGGIEKYLGSGLIKGIGPTYAKRIVQLFGEETFEIIDKSPERLCEVDGIGSKRLGRITGCWTDQKSIREVMVFLQAHGVSPGYAQKIFKTYGTASIKIVKETPYRLAQDIFGIGFKSADTIAQSLGIPRDSPQRIEAGIEFVLGELSSDGHVCYPVDELLAEAEKMLEVGQPAIEAGIQSLIKESRVMVEELLERGIPRPYIWIRALYMAEGGIVREVGRLKRAPCRLRGVEAERAVAWVQEKLKLQLADKQKDAVMMALQEKLLIITGGPGTGKSTITNAILCITEQLSRNIVLAAPTGRAAKRMSEITGKKASTIHSLLEFDFTKGKFKRNRENPIECDLIIIDEASMIDTLLMNNLLKAIPDHARVIFVGDINQLPSVGPGNVLKDMIASHTVAVVTLKEIFRQAAGSCIITNSHRINEGIFPDIRNQSDSDFFFIEAQEPQQVLEQIVSLVTHRLPKKYHFNPLSHIQVLAPMKRGIIGTENLNVVLQEALNSKDNPLFRGGNKLLVGDKVMQIRNNYTKEVFNGDIGYIAKIDAAEQQVLIDFEGKMVEYEFNDLDEIVLAYAVSIHKFQGSECPCIVIPIHTTHFKLLFRNLLYTGVTRGKKLVVLVGTKKALAIAVRNDDVLKRHTGLQQILSNLLATRNL